MILQKSIKVNNLEEIQEKINEVNVIGFECPKCKSHEFNYYGSYKRFLIVLIDEEPVELSVRIKRIRCKGCGKTHAIIPDFIIPYKIYIRNRNAKDRYLVAIRWNFLKEDIINY